MRTQTLFETNTALYSSTFSYNSPVLANSSHLASFNSSGTCIGYQNMAPYTGLITAGTGESKCSMPTMA